METREALLRAATYLKWFRDRAITVDTEPPDNIGEIIITLEHLADEEPVAGPPRTSSSPTYQHNPLVILRRRSTDRCRALHALPTESSYGGLTPMADRSES